MADSRPIPELDPNQNYTVKEMLALYVIPTLSDMKVNMEVRREKDNDRFEKLESAKNRITGALILITAVIVPLTIPIITAAVR